MYDTVNNRIKEISKKFCNGNISELARITGINQPALRDIVGKKRAKPGYEILTAIVDNSTLQINGNWLLTGEGEMQYRSANIESELPDALGTDFRTKTIHLYDVSAAAGYSSFDEIISNEKVIDTFIVPTFKDISWMIYVKGSSMYPKYSSGDIIACRVLYESRFIQWGKVYVVATKEQGILVKRLEQSQKDDHIKAVSDNPTYKPFDIPNDEILGIALVIGVVRLE